MGPASCRGSRVQGIKKNLWMWGRVRGSEEMGSRTLIIISPYALGCSNYSQGSDLTFPFPQLIHINSIQQEFIDCLIADTFFSWRFSIASLPLEPSFIYHSPDPGPWSPSIELGFLRESLTQLLFTNRV